tara:strand:- start:521 stop:1549 length:1029 start_codon:yes stop_codon:yes gene_type:complete
MILKNIFLLSSILTLFASCQKDELPLLAPNTNQNTNSIDTTGGENLIVKGEIISKTVHMGSDYATQIWFDLGTNSVIKTNLRTDWDLAFDCGLANNNLYLNSALNASVAFTSETDFNKVNSDAGLTYLFEHQSGRKELLAIGDISNNRSVFIIDRGYDPAGNPIGKWKAQITLVQEGDYFLTCAKLDGSNMQTTIISKKPQYNRVAYSFSSAKEIQIEPEKTDFDIVFTQYTHVFENEIPPLPYSVNGVLINSYKTEVAEEFSKKFNELSKIHAETLFYSRDWDVIGYDWKDFSLQTNTFTIFSDKIYLIKDASGNLFKLRFIDFYDDNGIKGSPAFEFMRL